MSQQIREKIERLIRLAERPGTPAEGENAKQRAIALSIKYGIACKYTPKTIPSKPKTTPGPMERASQQEIHDALMNKWIKALNNFGWKMISGSPTKVGRQICFRKSGFDSEVRVTQRKNGEDFEAEHIKNPDPTSDGRDRSFSIFMCVSIGQLLTHLAYTNNPST